MKKKHSVEYAPELTSEQLAKGNLSFFVGAVTVLALLYLVASVVM